MGRKRSNGMGSVFYDRSRRRWTAKVTVGYKPDGTPQRKVLTARTRADVEKRLRDAIDALDAGLAIPDPTTTIAEYATWWATTVLPAEGLAPRTELWYRQSLESYVLPHVGARTLTGRRALGVADVEAMCGTLADDYAPRTQRIARTALGKVLRSAEQRGLVARNVAYLATVPGDRHTQRTIKAFTEEEVASLLAGLDGSRWRPITEVALTTGLRPGELLGLMWPDVHLGDDPHVTVRQALRWEAGGVPVIGAPKRHRSYRTVPIPPETVTVLRAWRKTQAAEQLAAGELWSPDIDGLVFTRDNGRPVRVDTWRKEMVGALPGAHPHRCRHSYATYLLELGHPLHHVAELMGDTAATVENAYSHVLRPKHEVGLVAGGIIAR